MTPETVLIIKALSLCVESHKDQLDRAGVPYAFHPIRVAEKQTTATRIAIALLHDTVEDTDVTLEQIEATFGPEIAAAVGALSRGETESWNAYLSRVLENEDAMWVKKADLEDNTRVERIDRKAAEKMPMYREAHEKITKRLAELGCR